MSVKELTNITIAELWKEYKRIRNFWEEEDEAVKLFKRRCIEAALEEERAALIGCAFYEHRAERRDYRNGYWKRWIILKDGRLEIRMPRIRGPQRYNKFHSIGP